MNRFLIVALLALLLVSCSPDPRLQADAQAIRIKARQDAADQAQRREQDARRFDLEQAERKATSDAWVRAYSNFVNVSMGVLNLSVAVVLLALAIGSAIALIGLGRGVYNAAWVRSNLVAMDAETGQYPLMIQRVGNGQYTLTDPNTGQVLALQMSRQADRQMVAAAFAGRLNAVTARQARLSGNSQGSIMVETNPVVVMGGSDGQ